MHGTGQLGADEVRAWIQGVLSSADQGHLLHRLDGVLLVAEGRSCREVAHWFGVDRRTIERWIHAADACGVAGLDKHHCGGRPATLTRLQENAIMSALRACPAVFGYPDRRWTGKRLALHLYSHFGVVLSIRSCQRLITRQRRLA